MERAVEFLKKCGTFYLATEEGDQPRVRPFGAVIPFEGRIYLCTNNTKPCYAQMHANSKIEVSGTIGADWIRIVGTAVFDPRVEVKTAMLEAYPELKNRYSADDDIYEVFYIDQAEVTFASLTGAPSETYAL